MSEFIWLENSRVRLEPLTTEHIDNLLPYATNPKLWRGNNTIKITGRDDLEQYVQTALKERDSGQSIPFAVFDKKMNVYAGSTRFANIVWEHKRIEIGWTWIGQEFQGSGLNKAMKYELLNYCFEELLMNRVELKTNELNNQSRQAILSLGAKEEGVLRNHMIMYDGKLRNTVYYSITKEEWPMVKEKLQNRF